MSYPDVKPIHRAKLVRSDGKVSPLCARKPRVLNLRVATWTLIDELVTCEKCRPLLAANALEIATRKRAGP